MPIPHTLAAHYRNMPITRVLLYPKYPPTWPGRVRDMKVCMAWQAWAYAMAAAWD